MGVKSFLKNTKNIIFPEDEEKNIDVNDIDYKSITLDDETKNAISSIFNELKEKFPKKTTDIVTTSPSTTKTNNDNEEVAKYWNNKYKNWIHITCPKCQESSVFVSIKDDGTIDEDSNVRGNMYCYSCGHKLTPLEVIAYNTGVSKKNIKNNDDVDDDFDDTELITCPTCMAKRSVLIEKNKDGTIINGNYDCDNCGDFLGKKFIEDYNKRITGKKSIIDANTIRQYSYKCPKCNDWGITSDATTINGKTVWEYSPCKYCGFEYSNNKEVNKPKTTDKSSEEKDPNEPKIVDKYTHVKIKKDLGSLKQHLYNDIFAIVDKRNGDAYSLWLIKDGEIFTHLTGYNRDDFVVTPYQNRESAIKKIAEYNEKQLLRRKLR